MRKLQLLLASTAIIMGAPASADGIEELLGFRVGGSMGWDSNDTSVHFFDPDNNTNFGVFAGYNTQINGIVVGGEVQYVGLSEELGFSSSGDYNDLFELKLRAGVPIGRFLAYGVVGGVYGADNVDPYIGELSGTLYGAGVETSLGNGIFAGIEFTGQSLNTSCTGDCKYTAQSFTRRSLSARVGFAF